MEYISPDDGSLSPQQKAEYQNSILGRVYDPDYPFLDKERSYEQIQTGQQKVLFWGNSVRELSEGIGGTVALIRDAERGIEMCRTGATLRGGGSLAIEKLFNYYLDGEENQMFATVRNCEDRTNKNGKIIPGGVPIAAIYSKLHGVEYWGLAPWYIMPGDSVELLDLRIHTKNKLIKDRLHSGEKLWIASEEDRKIFGDMLNYNYGENEYFGLQDKEKTSEKPPRFNIKLANDIYSYSSIVIRSDGELTVEELKKKLDEYQDRLFFIKIDLFDSTQTSAQKIIEELGFKLVSIFPEGKKMVGYWFFAQNKTFAPPYYMKEDSPIVSLQPDAIEIQKRIVRKILGEIGDKSFFLKKGNDRIIDSYNSLRETCIRTEVRRLNWLDKIANVDVYGKFENEQLTGSFKIRGALTKVKKLQLEGKSIIAASAGNHGLAVAEAGKILGVDVSICIPENASSIKKERLAHYNHPLIQYGSSLEEATKHARDIAEQEGMEFISPFNDPDVIYGQGTVAIEICDQIQDIDTVIIPVGGGGLISGMAIYLKHNFPHIKVIGVEPANYNSLSSSLRNGEITRVTNLPTLADGLSVNLDPGSITYGIVRDYVDEIIEVTEEEIAASCLAILYHESKLVEPSGAISLAPILSGRVDASYGKIVTILSGGNVSTSNLAKMINYPFKDPNLAQFTGFTYPKVEHEVAMKGLSLSRKTPNNTNMMGDIEYDQSFIDNRFLEIQNRLDEILFKLNEYKAYCERTGIRPDQESLLKIDSIIKTLQENLELPKGIKAFHGHPGEYANRINQLLNQYRSCLHLLVTIELMLDYRSCAYDQSTDAKFFSLESQDSPNVNYNRYESSHLNKLELQLSQVLGINNETHSLLVASSGMAAFNLIENYLTKYVIKPGDTVALPGYIYFEAEEQVRKIPGIKYIKDNLHTTQDIIDFILLHKPRVVFLDPMTNNINLNMLDVKGVVQSVAELTDEKITFVIDGTMISGASNPFDYKKGDNIDILYYESCSKYLQLGLDVSMGGLLVTDAKNRNIFNRLRRNTGGIMYDHSVHAFPRFTREEHVARMQRFTRNALLVADTVNENKILSSQIQAIFPLQKEHPGYETAKEQPFIGGIVTFQFSNEYLNQRDSLNSLINRIIRKAQKYNLPISKGVSFGFSTPRISAAAVMNELDPPFLRLSVGDRSVGETELLCKILVESFAEFLSNNERETVE